MSPGRSARRGESGETLVEIVVAVAIMGIAMVAVVSALAAAVANATRQRTDATGQTVLNAYAERARGLAFIPCATAGEYTARLLDPPAPSGYTPSVTSVASWDGGTYRAGSTLTAGLAAGAGPATIRLADTAGFPAAPYEIRVDAATGVPERMTVTGAGPEANTLTVARASSAPEHEAGQAVSICPSDGPGATHYQAQLLDIRVNGPAISMLGAVQPYADRMSVAKRGPLEVPRFIAEAVAPDPPARAGTEVTLRDTARLVGAGEPTGDVTFTLYGPDQFDPGIGACTDPPAAPAVSVPAGGAQPFDGAVTFTPLQAGTYRWIASYSGDAAHEGATLACGAAGQSVAVAKAQPTLTAALATPSTVPPATTPTAVVGTGSTTATATLADGAAPTGTITFELYGPDDDDCAGGPVSTSATPVTGNDSFTSDPFTFAEAGSYRWRASYDGDDDNEPVAMTPCPTADDQTVTVTDAP